MLYEIGHRVLKRPLPPQKTFKNRKKNSWGTFGAPSAPNAAAPGEKTPLTPPPLVTALRVLQEAQQHIFTFSLPNPLAFRIVAGVSGFWDYDRLGTSLYVDSLHVFDGDMNQSASRQFRL